MLLEIKNVTHSFSPSKKTLDRVFLSLEEGQIYTLMGANGAGKTTLFNIITGFIKPQLGEVVFASTSIKGLPPHKINNLGVARTFQDLRLISKLTVKENIILAARNNPDQTWYNAIMPKLLYRSELSSLDRMAEKILSDCFLQDVKFSLAGKISYGQQKLLNLACCIANNAKLLLLDEPVAGVNPKYQKQILKLIRELKSKGKTILLIEHNTDFIQQITEQFLFLKEGKISNYDTLVELKEDKDIVSSYFES